MTVPDTEGLAPDLIETLEAISQNPEGPAAPVAFAQLDWELSRKGIDPAQTLLTLVPKYARRESTGPYFAPREQIRLTIPGLALTTPGSYVVRDVLDALKRLATFAIEFQPSPPDDLVPVVTRDDVASAFAADVFQRHGDGTRTADLVLDLLSRETPVFSAIERSEGDWRAELSREVRKYRDASTIGDYLAVVKGDQPASEGTNVSELQASAPDPRSVFVVHGRDEDAKVALENFLRALDLRPIEWEGDLVAGTGSGTPYTGDVVRHAFDVAHAVIVLLAPEEHFDLHPDFHRNDDSDEDRGGWQARPNVYFEAGMAFALHEERTIIVEIGTTRPASDIGGRQAVRLTGAPGTLNALAGRLRSAGCPVQTGGDAWLNGEPFRALVERPRAMAAATTAPGASADDLPLGRIIDADASPLRPRLSAQVLPHGKDHLVEIRNRGGLPLSDVKLTLPEDAGNWFIAFDQLPEYPIPVLGVREYVRVPAFIASGGPVITDGTLSASDPAGAEHAWPARLSIYG